MRLPISYSAWDTALALGTPWRERTDLGRVRTLEENQTLYFQGDEHDCFYLVRSGFLHTIVHGSNGKELLLEIFGPDTLFGEASAFVNKPRHVSAVAVTPVVLSQYKVSELKPALACEPELAISLIQLLGLKHRNLIDKLFEATSTGARERLEGLLARIATSSADLRSLRLTHEQIADMTGLNRVTVTRALKGLAEEGLISTRGKGVQILAPERLRQKLLEN